MIQFELDSDEKLFEDSLQFAQKQVRKLIEKHPDFYPIYTQNGKWKHDGPAWTRWCDGFLPGMLWMFHRHELAQGGKEAAFWKERAIHYSTPLEPRKNDKDIHDLGFLFLSTYYRWQRLDPKPKIEKVIVDAGKTLAQRYNEKGQYLRSFVGDDSLFIDIMMNVPIIFYAARATGDKKLREIAMRHTMTTQRVLVRGDGSTAHEGIFDIETGEFLRQSTQQGFRGDSCWSRGLAWALYGFGTCYEYSRDPHFLATAEACTDYYITHTPSDGIPPWDFNAPPGKRKLLDTSAAAIAASGMLRLSRLLHDPIKGHLYWATGLRILRSLCEKHLGKERGYEGILTGGVYHVHKNLGVDESVMWGDHFFVEGLEHLLRK